MDSEGLSQRRLFTRGGERGSKPGFGEERERGGESFYINGNAKRYGMLNVPQTVS